MRFVGDPQDTIEVQDHAKPSFSKFTLTKTCQEVRNRFNILLADHGCPWNCLEIRDQLSGFKGPMSLQQGEKLLHCQMADPEDRRKNRWGLYTSGMLQGGRSVVNGFRKNIPDQ